MVEDVPAARAYVGNVASAAVRAETSPVRFTFFLEIIGIYFVLKNKINKSYFVIVAVISDPLVFKHVAELHPFPRLNHQQLINQSNYFFA